MAKQKSGGRSGSGSQGPGGNKPTPGPGYPSKTGEKSGSKRANDPPKKK